MKHNFNVICLDDRYSTTRNVTLEKPEISNNPDDKFKTLLFLPPGEGRKGEGGLRTKGYFKMSCEGKPLISVITVVFNGEKYLEQTIKSVLNQTYDNVEYIIIDGGSTDGTLDIIKKYEHAIDYWVSEKDRGIYDAMNKGIQLSLGKFVGLINSDDWYEYDTINLVVESIHNDNTIEILYGNMNFIDVNFNTKKLFLGNITNLKKNMTINHSTCFVKRELYKEKLFNLNYKIAADYDLMLYFRFTNKKFFYINKLLANMRSGGFSSNIHNKIQELFLIHKKYFSNQHAYKYLLLNKAKVFIRDILSILLPPKLFNRIRGYK